MTEPNKVDELAAIESVYARAVHLIAYWQESAERLVQQFLSWQGMLQLGVLLFTGLLALMLSKVLDRRLFGTASAEPYEPPKERYRPLLRLLFPVFWVVGLWIGTAALTNLNSGNDLLRTGATLLNAWILIRLFTHLVGDSGWSRAFAVIAWAVAALYVVRLLRPTMELLDSAALTIGESRISLLLVANLVVMAFLVLGLASILTRFLQERIRRTKSLSPSVQTLVGQSVRLGLLIVAIAVTLSAAGIDLTALAVFSGAVGIGIGFGLQAVFSNLVAGIIVLLEDSVRVGDFVDLQSGVTGEVKDISVRSMRITTNDNVDVLVPNAEFISGRVTSWTLKDRSRRLRIPFGVAYGSDKELVRQSVLNAIANVPHLLKPQKGRESQVWLVGFGDNSLNFELVVWLNAEAVMRPGRVNADFCWAIESALVQAGLEIPFPQRDLHIRSGTLAVKLTQSNDFGGESDTT